MKIFLPILLYFSSIFLSPLFAQDTFSIVAVDSATGEVGSAGASCLDDSDIEGGVYIITDIIPGRGAINTQARWDPRNQDKALLQLEMGNSPDEVIRYMRQSVNDALFNPAIRQYGVAALDTSGHPSAAAFTGDDAMDWKGHLVGRNYAIQGNILLGPEILDSMEARFLRTDSLPLAQRLMAAMQGANVPGADTRCLSEGVSSQSAFLRVARPGDDEDSLYLDLKVTQTPFGEEPVDSLQKQFDQWRGVSSLEEQAQQSKTLYAHYRDGYVEISGWEGGKAEVRIYRLNGQLAANTTLDARGVGQLSPSLAEGTYLLQLQPQKSPFKAIRLLVR